MNFNLRLYILLIGCIMFYGCQNDAPLFTLLVPQETGVLFSNTITETEEMNINQYLYAHNGGGVSVGDINNDGLPDIYFTANQLENKLYINKGNFKFEDITEKAGVGGTYGTNWKNGVVMADVNGDGWLDIYVSQISNYKTFDGSNQLFINNGDLTFTEKSKDYGLDLTSYSQQAAFFDYDRDGDLDMYQLNLAVHNPDVYIKTEFRSKRDSLAGDRLFKNDNGKFKDVSSTAGIYGGAAGYGLAVGIADIDNDSWPDIYVSNDFHENDFVYYNNGDGTFREDVKGTLGHCSTFSMGNDIADFNNDGWLDILTMDMKSPDEIIKKKSAGPDPFDIYNFKLGYGYYYQYPRNMLHLNRGNLFGKSVQFSEIGQLSGVDATDWSWSGLMADFDNDGWKDIVITNGIIRRPIDLDYINFTYNDEVHKTLSSLEMAYKMPEGSVTNYAYQNKRGLTFKDVSKVWGLDLKGCSMGVAYADFDNDGDLDLVINNLNSPASVYRNNSESTSQNNFIKVKLEGDNKNKFGVGARIELETEVGMMVQELNPTRGWLSSVDYVLNFGLGESEKIAKLTVKWLDGSEQILKDVQSNQTLIIKKENAQVHERSVTPVKLFEDITSLSGISFQHRENTFVDFNNERLIPHMLSTEGPRLAIADVNNDGLEDFYVGGAAGQAGELYFQKGMDSTFFQKYTGDVFELDKNYEDVESVFFDADADGDTDLFIVSGGGQFVNSYENQSRLYLNDGGGNFTKSKKSLPDMTANGSCVVGADFNMDGAIDLFVGTRSLVGNYGASPDSYLLWNNGKGIFSNDTTSYASMLHELGMVTSAVWLDKTKELVVVGEWMPITYLKFETNKITKRELKGSSGWWNTICAADIDNDGDDDLLLGNLGLNSDLRTSMTEPIGLYVNDFDNNSMTDPILTYYRNQHEWIYPGLDEIKKQIPSIRLRYPKYENYANDPLAKVFPTEILKKSIQKKAMMFQSVYLINDGSGEYAIHDFPLLMQFAPIYSFLVDDFNSDGRNDILASGNFNNSSPAIGRFDASYGNLIIGMGEGKFEEVEPRASGFAVYGEARDMKLIHARDSKWILISRNNVPMRILKTRNNNNRKLTLQ